MVRYKECPKCGIATTRDKKCPKCGTNLKKVHAQGESNIIGRKNNGQ